MATKTQFAVAFLLLAMMSSSYASAQLLTCPILLVKVLCRPLSIFPIINLPIIVNLKRLCCNLFKNLTANQTANCLCLSFKFPPLSAPSIAFSRDAERTLPSALALDRSMLRRRCVVYLCKCCSINKDNSNVVCLKTFSSVRIVLLAKPIPMLE